MGGPGSVAFNFEQKGLIVVEKEGDTEEQLLKLIDAEVDDVEVTDNGIEVYVPTGKLSEKGKVLQEMDFKVVSAELMQKPKITVTVSDLVKAQKVIAFLDKLEEYEDVQKVFANLNIPDDVLSQISSV